MQKYDLTHPCVPLIFNCKILSFERSDYAGCDIWKNEHHCFMLSVSWHTNPRNKGQWLFYFEFSLHLSSEGFSQYALTYSTVAIVPTLTKEHSIFMWLTGGIVVWNPLATRVFKESLRFLFNHRFSIPIS